MPPSGKGQVLAFAVTDGHFSGLEGSGTWTPTSQVSGPAPGRAQQGTGADLLWFSGTRLQDTSIFVKHRPSGSAFN